MRKLILDKQLVDDGWKYLDNDDSLLSGVDVVVPLARWKAERETLRQHDAGVGVRIEPGEGIEDIVPDLADIPLVCLNFPTFYDGRGLSYARELREHHRYSGQIRAVGDVHRDVVLGMYRCGINAFDIREGKSIADALIAFGDFSTAYQGDVYDPRPLYRRGA